MISVINLEKCMAGGGILGVVIGELCHEKKLCPIILLEVDKSLEVGFYHTILPFDLLVHLRVESSRKFLLNA